MNATSRLSLSSLATALARLYLDRGCTQLRPQIEGVGALARLYLDKLTGELKLLGFSEAAYRFALGVEAEARAALPVGRDAQVGDYF
jgi:hypothetical protein